MTGKTKKPTAPKASTLPLSTKPGQSQAAAMAGALANPRVTAATVVTAYSGQLGGTALGEAIKVLTAKAKLVNDGNMYDVESTLTAQAAALNTIFTDLALTARRQEYMQQFEANLKLALRAQNQCRMTLETLATIKNPPVVFAKQANIANNQQVNNGHAVPAARAGEIGNGPNKQSRIGHDKGQSLDGGTLQGAIGSRAPLEAMAAVNRPKDSQG